MVFTGFGMFCGFVSGLLQILKVFFAIVRVETCLWFIKVLCGLEGFCCGKIVWF